MKHVIHLMCAVSTSHTVLFLRLLTLHTMSSGTREMMFFLVFLLALVFLPVPVEALDAQCTDSRCLSEYAPQTHLVFLDTQGQSCCYNLLGCQTCTSVSNPLILFGQHFQVVKEAQLNTQKSSALCASPAPAASIPWDLALILP